MVALEHNGEVGYGGVKAPAAFSSVIQMTATAGVPSTKF
jgi:hypothetical protein